MPPPVCLPAVSSLLAHHRVSLHPVRLLVLAIAGHNESLPGCAGTALDSVHWALEPRLQDEPQSRAAAGEGSASSCHRRFRGRRQSSECSVAGCGSCKLLCCACTLLLVLQALHLLASVWCIPLRCSCALGEGALLKGGGEDALEAFMLGWCLLDRVEAPVHGHIDNASSPSLPPWGTTLLPLAVFHPARFV